MGDEKRLKREKAGAGASLPSLFPTGSCGEETRTEEERLVLNWEKDTNKTWW